VNDDTIVNTVLTLSVLFIFTAIALLATHLINCNHPALNIVTAVLGFAAGWLVSRKIWNT